MRVALFTIGCKVNQYETEAIAERLEALGFERVDFREKADVYVINTCTVTGESDRSSRQAIYRARRKSPDAKIIVTGCYAQLEKEYLERLPGVSLVVKQEEKGRLPALIVQLQGLGAGGEGRPATPIAGVKGIGARGEEIKDEFFGFGVKGLAKHTRALVKIQDGCEKTCAYCVVPFARGKERSREAGQIISEVNNLVENGYKEVVLTGVHVGRYNRDGSDLVDLSEKSLNETKVERIRFSSIDPNEFSDEMIDFISRSDRICRHLHVPLQSGEDVVLSKMKREYTADDYRTLADKISRAVPGVLIGADVIVGFPGETDEQFENTCQFIRSSPVNYLHVFSYSDRKGTEASSMPAKVPPQVIHKRSEIMHGLGKEKWRDYIQGFVGKKLNVLIENRRDRKTGMLTGLSDNYIRVLLDGDDSLKNRIIPVPIIDRHENSLLGEVEIL
ncbi:MAG: tRNA (N(6)-L-threonylcarbamoyladenosine(37)-C(2))-methylthiotransferase MtaB [Candidatus Zixiibacteriota bacterium]